MLEKDLINLIQKIQSLNSELNNIEVKEAHEGCPKKLYDTISAFSNLNGGGVILFGLKEKNNFSVTGVYNAADLQKKVTEQCKQMTPVVRAIFTSVKIDNKIVVSAEIPEIDIADKPCFYAGKGRLTGSYIRVGDSDEQMTEYEIYSYEAFKKKYQDDIRTINSAPFSLLEKEKLNNYIRILKERKTKLASMPEKEIYELMRITKNGIPTLCGLMIFGKYPQGLFPQFSITAVSVPGNELGELGTNGERFIDNKRIDGTIPEMLEDAIRFIHNNMSISTIINPQTGNRQDKEEYPTIAVREIILNALIHRDYSIHTEGKPIQILMFKNRLEIISPGGLYGRININDLGKIQPDTRNPALAIIMEDLGLTENRYSGIPTIYKIMREEHFAPPVFSDVRGSFKVTLNNKNSIFNNDSNENNNIDQQDNHQDYDLLSFCYKPRTRNEIKEFLGLKSMDYIVRQYINPLINEGKLKMTLPTKPRSRYQKYMTNKTYTDKNK